MKNMDLDRHSDFLGNPFINNSLGLVATYLRKYVILFDYFHNFCDYLSLTKIEHLRRILDVLVVLYPDSKNLLHYKFTLLNIYMDCKITRDLIGQTHLDKKIKEILKNNQKDCIIWLIYLEFNIINYERKKNFEFIKKIISNLIGFCEQKNQDDLLVLCIL